MKNNINILEVSSKNLSIYSFLLFCVPTVTLLICIQIHILHYDLNSFPFTDGEFSVSFIGRQEKTINFFKLGFIIFIIISVLFHFKISNFFSLKKIKNKFKLLGILSNIFLFIYIFSLGKDSSIYEILKRVGIILFIVTMYINHFYMIKILKSQNIINFKKIYLSFLYIIFIFMTVLIIIGMPWVNPLFAYPDKLKNIVEWNYFLLTIIFYLPISTLFYQFYRLKQS
tara:strand:- start:261 stop:941 length:681 start_codon:yes stop_codon:yes gene_type:complete